MALSRFYGHHVAGAGRPGAFRTLAGTMIPPGVKGIAIESLFSRKGETANLDAMKIQHAQAVEQFDAKKDSAVYITNNVPHIERLNEGWSQQTSPGFFERALLQAKKSVLGTWRLRSIP